MFFGVFVVAVTMFPDLRMISTVEGLNTALLANYWLLCEKISLIVSLMHAKKWFESLSDDVESFPLYSVSFFQSPHILRLTGFVGRFILGLDLVDVK